jgi:hypothetical protein
MVVGGAPSRRALALRPGWLLLVLAVAAVLRGPLAVSSAQAQDGADQEEQAEQEEDGGTGGAGPGGRAGQRDPDTIPDPVPADSTRWHGFFHRIGVHPELDSSFDVNRGATTFQQGANFQRHFGPTLVRSNWGVTVQSNETQNDRRQVSGVSSTRVARSGRAQGGWKFGSDFGLSRKGVKTTFTRNVVNETKIDLVGQSGVLGHFARERLDLEDETLSWVADGTFGAVRRDGINERNSRSDPRLLETADSTRTEGTDWNLTSDLSLTPAEAWQFEFSGGMAQGRSSYDTLLRPNPDSTAFQTGQNRDRDRDLDIKGTFRPSRGNEVRVSAGWGLSRSQYYSTTEKAQETSDGHARNLEIALLSEPLWGIKTEAKARTNTTATRFALSENGASKDGHSFDGRLSFELGDAFGWFDGVEVIGEGSAGNTITVYQEPETAGFEEDVVALKGSLKRTWSRGTAATLSASGDLSQKYYEEIPGISRQDQDRLKQRVDFGFSYQLTPSVETVSAINWAATSTVNIKADRAAANVDETSLSASGMYTWTVWNDSRLVQDLVINAASTTRPYAEDESQLRRTTSLRSAIDAALFARARLFLEHYFQFQNQGAYLVDGRSGVRRFLKDTESLTQRAEAEVKYAFWPGLELFYRQKFEIRGSKNLITEEVNERLTTEIRWGGIFRHQIDPDFMIDVDFDRISSTVENSYWVGKARVSRLF